MAVGTSPRTEIDPTAFITSPAEDDTMILAPYTCHFDGYSSTDGNAPIVRYGWDFGDAASADPQTDEGIQVTHRFDNAGTYNVTLTVTDNDGRTHSAVLQVVVVAFTGADRYVDFTNGNDSWDGTAGAFVAGTTGPWKTLAYAIDQMVLLGSRNNPNRLYLRKDETWEIGPTDGTGGTNSISSGGTPMILDAYALAAEVNDPIIVFLTSSGVYEISAPSSTADFGYATIMQNLELQYPDAHQVQRILLMHASGSVLRDSVVTNSGVYSSSGGHTHMTVEDCSIVDSGDDGMWTNNDQWNFRRNTVSGHGNDPQTASGIYLSEAQKVLVEGCTIDGTGANATNQGFKLRQAEKIVLRGNEVKNYRNTGQCGAEPQLGDTKLTRDVIIEGNKFHATGEGNESRGIIVDFGTDILIRNNLFYNMKLWRDDAPDPATGFGVAAIQFTLASPGVPGETMFLRVYNNTFHDIEIHCIDITFIATTDWVCDVINNIFERTAGTGANKSFLHTDAAPDLLNLHMDWNHFLWPALTDPAVDLVFALLNRTANTKFDDWKLLSHLPDANSNFGSDPLISSPPPDTNMKPTGGSPAIDDGRKAHQHVDVDYADVRRHTGNKWDIGAYEQ